jgi:CubicO group peptidase (beta-lactamase class C family)
MSHAEQVIKRYIQDDGFTGAALAVAKGGTLIYEHYAGEAAPGLASSNQVLWNIASISKLYTAAAIMRLVEQGVLTLNTIVCKVLPKFSGEGRDDIRLRHLLTHTSGLIYESTDMPARLAAQTSLQDLIEESYTAPLLFKPGTSLSYADYNYLLAGHVAATVTGQSFTELVRECVLGPMKLSQTFFPPPISEYKRISRVRGAMAEGTKGAMYNSSYALSLAHPAFGVVATATDLLRFALHFAPKGPRLYSSPTVRAMTTDQTGFVMGQHISLKGIASDARVPWGIGFALQNKYVPSLFSDLASHSTFGHGGASGCQVIVDPEADLTLAFLSNTHLNTGREKWSARLQSVINSTFAEYGG